LPSKKFKYDSELDVFALAKQPFKIELIVINSVAFDAPFHEELYDWLDRVVDIATSERRNQRVRIFLLLMLYIAYQSFYFYDSLLTLGLWHRLA